jgi:DNA primase
LRELSRHCDLSSAEGRARLVADAKPLAWPPAIAIIAAATGQALAQVSGFSQAEVERLCSLRAIVKPAPARAPRQAPSLLRPLLRLLLQKPQLASRLPLELLPEHRRKRARCACSAKRLPAPVRMLAYPALLEKLRGSADEGSCTPRQLN